MKKIPLTQGFSALVDDEDFEALKKFKWRVLQLKHTCYAVRSKRISEEGPALIYMHRAILSCQPYEFADHRNGKGLDNRRCNLRICTRSQNQRNMKRYVDSRTGLKGVDFFKQKKKFRARIILGGKQRHLGLFNSAPEAHAAYCAAAREHFGEFARFQ